MAEIIYSKYSNERSRRFAIRTDILEENKKRWLQKKKLFYPEGKRAYGQSGFLEQQIKCCVRESPLCMQ